MDAAADQVVIDTAGVALDGLLALPAAAIGVVLFAHGSGSSRFSVRNNFVARVLQRAAIGTLLIDLLTADEDREMQARFDIGLLSARLAAALRWLRRHGETRALPIGLFGASTGAAAALQVAAHMPQEVAAVVSRGGRPELAAPTLLEKLRAPTLLLVGGADTAVIAFNRQALALMDCVKRLEVIAGASHLFEEPGTLEAVAAQAADWFRQYLPGSLPGSAAAAGNAP